MKKYLFENIFIEKCIYENEKLQIKYRHKNYKKNLVFTDVKSFKSVFTELYYYDELLKELEIEKFEKMININKQRNKICIIDGLWIRYILEFNQHKRKR